MGKKSCGPAQFKDKKQKFEGDFSTQGEKFLKGGRKGKRERWDVSDERDGNAGFGNVGQGLQNQKVNRKKGGRRNGGREVKNQIDGNCSRKKKHGGHRGRGPLKKRKPKPYRGTGRRGKTRGERREIEHARQKKTARLEMPNHRPSNETDHSLPKGKKRGEKKKESLPRVRK